MYGCMRMYACMEKSIMVIVLNLCMFVAPGPEMSTPFQGGGLQHNPFLFDEEEMAREVALVLAALQEARMSHSQLLVR